MTSIKSRKKIIVQGIVQGVGFRPFIFNLAAKNQLTGLVINSSLGVEIEIEGVIPALDRFISEISILAPPHSQIKNISVKEIPLKNSEVFSIHTSESTATSHVFISPDIAICEDCSRELLASSDRRFEYPFINCTNCGPRYTIIKNTPYDRPFTTMADFNMCPQCRKEYNDPTERRFHAQPNACSLCGPKVYLVDAAAKTKDDGLPLKAAGALLSAGEIITVKGLGGFHFACDARNNSAVRTLRQRKHRYARPFAVMSADLSEIANFACCTSTEKELLEDPRKPIVILSRIKKYDLAHAIAPDNNYIGVMLPYTPLHLLLFQHAPQTLVMTSANYSDEPLVYKNNDALERLTPICNLFLMHNRDICRRIDDSVFQVINDQPRPIRRSRGWVPAPIFLKEKGISVLATGAQLKNTFCLTRDDEAFLSTHIGDLENVETMAFFEESIFHFRNILQIKPTVIAHDLHPDYPSTHWAKNQELPCIPVQHHHAHIVSCLAEHKTSERVIGLAMDGTGYGDDGCIWGGEVLLADEEEYQRAAHFCYRPLPGAAASIREPWRLAVSYLHAALTNSKAGYGEPIKLMDKISLLPFIDDIGKESVKIIINMIETKTNIVQTSSLGRLFDGIAAITGLKSKADFDGQAAILLEAALGEEKHLQNGYKFRIFEENRKFLISPDEVVIAVMRDVIAGEECRMISVKFHSALVFCFEDICLKISRQTGLKTVVLSGGCFQNRFLLTCLKNRLVHSGFKVLTNEQVPVNDGGIALGQAVVAMRKCKQK